jgi:predicted methyltransferase
MSLLALPTLRAAGALAALLALAACSTLPQGGASARPADYDAVVANPLRTDADRRIDAERHPQQFLAFAGVRPGMRVLDVSAGAGYTSQILALAVAPGGIVYAQTPRPSQALQARMAAHPQHDLEVVTRPFDDPVPPQAHDLDLVTLVQNYHDIANLPLDRGVMNRRLFAALRPGGHMVVVDHAAPVGSGTADTRTLHRIDEAVVRRELTEAGFVLEAEGDFLRNPADPRDRPSANSPFPTDKFALRFVKPR